MERIEIKLKSRFSLDKTLKSEQCAADLWFLEGKCWCSYLPVENKWVKVMLRQVGNKISVKFSPSAKAERVKSLISYIFSLDCKTDEISQAFRDDRYLAKVLRQCSGLRIMRDINKEYRILEALLTQNTSVRMIKRMQRLLFLCYGERVRVGNELISTYPDIGKIARERVETLKEKCRLGYRAIYLKNIARKLSSGEIKIEKLEKMSSEKAKRFLMRFRGIGNKVSDIILMYGFGKQDVFPLDSWVRNAIKREYFGNSKIDDREIYRFAKEYFGSYASIINLMIFFYERRNKNLFFNYCVWK